MIPDNSVSVRGRRRAEPPAAQHQRDGERWEITLHQRLIPFREESHSNCAGFFTDGGKKMERKDYPSQTLTYFLRGNYLDQTQNLVNLNFPLRAMVVKAVHCAACQGHRTVCTVWGHRSIKYVIIKHLKAEGLGGGTSWPNTGHCSSSN